MPPSYVKTVRDELLYEYAKLMSRSVFAGQINYRFVTDRFKALRSGAINISNTMREWQHEQELPKECVFCKLTSDLQMDHLIPRSRGGPSSSDNMVWACRACNGSRGDKGIFQWLGLKQKDHLHRLVAGKYLKLLIELHQTHGTLDINKNDIHTLCHNCTNTSTCHKWGTEKKLTCFCLESIF